MKMRGQEFFDCVDVKVAIKEQEITLRQWMQIFFIGTSQGLLNEHYREAAQTDGSTESLDAYQRIVDHSLYRLTGERTSLRSSSEADSE